MDTFTLFPTSNRQFCLSCFFFLALSFTAKSYSNPVPPADLTCPDDIEVELQNWQCGYYIDYDTLNWSSTEMLVDTLFSPGPGYLFETDTTMVTLEVTDINGDTSSCTFNVIVPPPTMSLTCDDNVAVELLGVCQMEVTADVILEGGPYGCIDDYIVSILSPVGADLGNFVNLSFYGSTWTVRITDTNSGYYCWGSIHIEPDSLIQDINCPNDTTIFCHEPNDTSDLGIPFIETCLDENQIGFTYFDIKNNSFCDGDDIAFTIERKWTAMSDGYGEESYCSQIITAVRPGIDDFDFPPDFDGIDQPKLVCSDSTPPSVLADTSITGVPLINGLNPFTSPCRYSFHVSDSIANPCGKQYEIMREWLIFDNCDDDIFSHVQTIIIGDDEGPVFSVPDTIHVSTVLPCGAESVLPPINLLAGCSAFEVMIETPWNTHNTNGAITGVPQIPGNYPAVYTATDACGNESIDTAILSVSDIVVASCPETVTILCDEYFNDLQQGLDTGNYAVLAPYGYPEFAANCDLSLTENVSVDVDSCGNGTITRDFATVEGIGSCQQTIEVQHVSDFIVEFPADMDINCGSSPPVSIVPDILNGSCELLQVDFTDVIYNDVPGHCYKIIRTWTVVNPCVVGVETDQEIVEESELDMRLAGCLSIVDLECDLDGDGDCDDRTFRDSWASCNLPTSNEATNVTSPDTDPDPNPWDGYITYEQVIKVTDYVDPVFTNGCDIPDVCTGQNTCSGTVTLPQQAITDCSTDFVELTVQLNIGNNWITGFGPYLNVPPGEYQVKYIASDNCNNQTACETTVTVKDCLAPTIICTPTMDVELNYDPNTGTEWVNVFVVDIVQPTSFDNCAGSLSFSFSANSVESFKTFTCDDLGTQILETWATDVAGNQSSCETVLTVHPNFYISDPCNADPVFISGNISTEEGEGIKGVEIPAIPLYTIYTDGDGDFSLYNPADTMTITPYLNANHGNGVTTFDQVLITKHVLGLTPLDGPYKLIAGDVNNSGKVTTFDGVQIRKMVLGNISSFPGNTSWRFVPSGYVFPDPYNPFVPAIPDSIFVDASINPTANFIGIKIGDLNGTAVTNFSNPVEERSFIDEINFYLPANYVKKGEVISLPMSLETPIHGFQLALGFDTEQLEWLDAIPGFVDEGAFGKNQIDEGILKISWASPEPFYPERGQPAFTIRFVPKANGDIGKWIKIDPGALKAEAYSEDLGFLKPVLHFQQNNSTKGSSQLFQNHPNPFDEVTTIPFYLSESSEVEFNFFSPSGKLVYAKKGYFENGYREIQVTTEALGVSGMVFFEMKTVGGIFYGKMVLQ